MIGIIVAGHGNFASGITSMLELVVGKPENYEYIDFLQGESQEALEYDYSCLLYTSDAADEL